MFLNRGRVCENVVLMGDWFYSVPVLRGIVLFLWGSQTPAQHWIKIVHPWVQKFYPVLGLGSGGRLLCHFQTPVLYWINFSQRFECFFWDLEDSHRKSNPCLFRSLLCMLPNKQGKEDHGKRHAASSSTLPSPESANILIRRQQSTSQPALWESFWGSAKGVSIERGGSRNLLRKKMGS